MHLSGILVLADPERIDDCRRELESLPGVEVHHSHRPAGRLMVILESATLEGQEEGLRRIQDLSAVRLAALVEHRVEPEDVEAPDREAPGSPDSSPEGSGRS